MAGPEEITDAEALRAITHPGRVRLLEELMLSGPATATELGERVGESPAWCSWHLRQLARYGFVEDAGGASGRQRPWRVVPGVRTWGHEDGNTDLNIAGDAAADLLLDHEVAALRVWESRRRAAPKEWRSAAFVNQAFTWLTADELGKLGKQISELFAEYMNRLDEANRPADSIPVRMTAWGIPARLNTNQ